MKSYESENVGSSLLSMHVLALQLPSLIRQTLTHVTEEGSDGHGVRQARSD